ncbi:MAG: hypothetical protein WB493_06205, partial [Anaeromyxobacteraceae bacterium]
MARPGQRSWLASVALLAAVALVAPGVASGKGTARGAKPAAPAARPKDGGAAKGASPALQKARAELAAVKASPAKRRYRHNWEKAIRSLEKAARGPDTGPA